MAIKIFLVQLSLFQPSASSMPTSFSPLLLLSKPWESYQLGHGPGTHSSGRVPEHLAQVGQEGFVLAQGLARRVGWFGHRLSVAFHEFHDDVERLRPQVVAEVRADAEATGHAVREPVVDLERARQVEAVGEHQ